MSVHRHPPHPADVIEISDDDDSDDYVPPASPRSRTRASQTRSLSVASAYTPGSPGFEDSPDAFDPSSRAASEESDAEVPSPAHKRIKLGHRIKIERRASPPGFQAQYAAIQRTRVQGSQEANSEFGGPAEASATAAATATITGTGPDQPDDELRQPPYYYDVKLDCRMYRGPGYEYFPVALGTVDGHEEKCDEWDAITAVEAHRAQLGLPASPEEVSSNVAQDFDAEMTDILGHLLEVLPDVDQSFALRKIQEHLTQFIPTQNHHFNPRLAASDIVSRILDAESYPKESTKGSRKGKEQATIDETGVTIVWDRTLVKNGPYLKEAVVLLSGQFPHVPTHYIFKVVHEKRSIFDTFIHVNDIDNKYYTLTPRPYIRHRNPRTVLEKKYAIRTNQERRDLQKFPQMVNELQAAKQYIAQESLKLEKKKEKEEAEATNLEVHKLIGDVVECQCCFDDEIPMNRTVTCQGDKVHFFCFGCINQLADTQVGLMKYEMLCMDGGGCTAPLSTNSVGQAIPMKTFDRLAFNQQQAEIAAAEIEGLEQCPFCDFKGICGPMEEEPVFNCQNPECFRATCRLCKEDAHVPKTCEEAKVDKGLSARHVVEEARTEAMIRKCPKCKVKIVKELGCNKMTCNQCHCIMCYACKADISNGKEGGYEHFNRPGAKCSLYDKPGRDLHEEEANAAEEEAIRQAKEDDAELDEKLLRIETGKHVKKKVKSHQARVAPLLPPAPLPGFALNDGLLRNLLHRQPPQRGLPGHPFQPHDQYLRQQVKELDHTRDRLARQPQGFHDRAQHAAGRDEGQPGNDLIPLHPPLARENLHQHNGAMLIAGADAQRRQQETIRTTQQAAANRQAGYLGFQGFLLPGMQMPMVPYAQPNLGIHWALQQGAELPLAAPLRPEDGDEWHGFDDGFGGPQQLFDGVNHNANWPDVPQYPMDYRDHMNL